MKRRGPAARPVARPVIASSERVRLSALYGGLLVLAGAMLAAGVYYLVRRGLYSSIDTAVAEVAERVVIPGEVPPAGGLEPAIGPPTVHAAPSLAARATVTDAAEEAALSQLLTISLFALALYALLSMALAWWMAGRVLRPVAVITETARRLSGENLHERIALEGPSGELKRLADTFDSMLGRMEHLVAAQRRFAANAAHELRTPLAVQRAAAEIGLAGEPDQEAIVRIRAKLLEIADDSEQTIEGLLLLATSEEGLQRREPVAVHDTVRTLAESLAAEAAQREVTVSVRTEPLTVQGDAVLLDRLVHNLLANGIRHNARGGRVEVLTDAAGITVMNTGPVIPPKTVPLLFEPFRRLAERRQGPGEGAGLGLSIVTSIARAHGASAAARANPAPAGGLTVTVRF